MLTFNVILGHQGLLFRDFLWFFLFVFFFQSHRPTQYQETHLTLNEKNKKGGMAYDDLFFDSCPVEVHR